MLSILFVTVLFIRQSEDKRHQVEGLYTTPLPLAIFSSFGGSLSLNGKESACNAGDPGSIAGSGRSSGEGNGNPLQYSWLENPMDRGA